MKKTFLKLALIALASPIFLCACNFEKTTTSPKYVFYFISDGTGINTVLGTEMYHASLADTIGRAPLCMTQFPVVGVATTHSASSPVTDSAASGTALATGGKTGNGVIGKAADGKTDLYSIAHYAKQAGTRVSVGSSVCLNHATPSAFYAHNKSRNNYYEIGAQAPEAGFDFYVASGFNKAVPKDSTFADLYTIATDFGYVFARGLSDYYCKSDSAERMFLFQPEGRDPFSLPYAIDARPEHMTAAQMVEAQIDFMMKDSTAGFFIMNEVGGKVDMACHANDGATAFAEVAMVDSCVRIAYEFYLRHPQQTLIVVTSDHETGGLVLSPKHTGDLKILSSQKGSQDAFTARLHELRSETHNRVAWEQIKEALADHYGFWSEIKLTDAEEKELKHIYEKSFKGKMPNEKNLYSENEPLAGTANRIINAKAGLRWATGSHSAGLVPVYAIGVGAEHFSTCNDNALIPLQIAKIAGYPMP